MDFLLNNNNNTLVNNNTKLLRWSVVNIPKHTLHEATDESGVFNLLKFEHAPKKETKRNVLVCLLVCMYMAVVSVVGLSVLRNALALFLLYCVTIGCVLRINDEEDQSDVSPWSSVTSVLINCFCTLYL